MLFKMIQEIIHTTCLSYLRQGHMQPSWPFILYLVTTQSNVTKASMEVSLLWNSQVGM